MIEAKETLVGQISSNQNLRGELLPRGPKGDKGEKGDKGDKGDTGAKGADGKDGAMQYEAGENITIEGNVISATGGGGGEQIPILDFGTQENPNKAESGMYYAEKTGVYYFELANPYNQPKKVVNINFNKSSLILIDYNEDSGQTLINCISGSRITFYPLQYYDFNINYEKYSAYIGNILTTNRMSYNYSVRHISDSWNFTLLPTSSVNPTSADEFTRKGYVDALPTTYSGYDATKTQVLKNINGTLTWVNE